MKKYFITILAAIFLSNCEIRVKTAQAQGDETGIYGYSEEYKDGMKFGVWYVKGHSSQTGYDIEVVNLTKEALEVELLKKQLEKLK